MASDTDAPVDLYIAAYADPDAARADWDAIKQLATDDVIKVDGLVLVSRRADGKIHVDDDFHTAAKGAAWGAVGGAVVGLDLPARLAGQRGGGRGRGSGRWWAGVACPEGGDQGRRRRHAAAQQFRHRGVVRAAMGGRCRQGALGRQQGDEGAGRLGQRRAGQGRGHEESAGYDGVAPNPARPCSA